MLKLDKNYDPEDSFQPALVKLPILFSDSANQIAFSHPSSLSSFFFIKLTKRPAQVFRGKSLKSCEPHKNCTPCVPILTLKLAPLSSSHIINFKRSSDLQKVMSYFVKRTQNFVFLSLTADNFLLMLSDKVCHFKFCKSWRLRECVW